MKRSAAFGRRDSFVSRGSRAFTLVELLIVLTIIFVLTGMVLTAAGYVSKKGARTRAESEMAALTAAIESYKIDNGNYPRDPGNQSGNNSITDSLQANAIAAGNPENYAAASQFLYGQLSGDYDSSAAPNSTTNYNSVIDTANEQANRAYFNFRPSMLSISIIAKGNAPTGGGGGGGGGGPPPSNTTLVNFIRDPFGYPYGYSTAGQALTGKDYFNPTYDLWTTGGTICRDASDGCMARGGTIVNKSQWITNW